MKLDLTPSQILTVKMALISFQNELLLQLMCDHSNEEAAANASMCIDINKMLSNISEGK